MAQDIFSPFDSEAGHSWFLGEDVSLHSLNDRLRRWLSVELIRVVLVVDVVSDAHKLAAIVGAGEEDDRNAKNIGVGDASGVGSLGLEDEFVDSDRNGADKKGV